MNGNIKVLNKYDVENKVEKAERAISSVTYLLIKRAFDIICGIIQSNLPSSTCIDS